MTPAEQKATQLRAVPPQAAPEFEVAEAYPVVPDGEYLAVCTASEVSQVFKTLKIFIHFRIADGPHTGVTLFRAYPVKGHIIPGKGPGTGARPKLHRRSDLYRMLCRVLELPVNTKAARISTKELYGRLFRVRSRTVSIDSKQRPLPEGERYSVVDDVLSMETA